MLSKYRVARIDWAIGGYVDSIRFTMSNGDKSPKYGTRPFSDFCPFESAITKIVVHVSEHRIAGIIIHTEHDGEFLRIESPALQSSAAAVSTELHGTESILGFKLRLSRGSLTGISCMILSSKEVIQALEERRQGESS